MPANPASPGDSAEPRDLRNTAHPARNSACNEQAPQPFLVAAHFDAHAAMRPGQAAEFQELLKRAIRYRTEQYGYFEGYGTRAWNARAPGELARVTTFFGVPVNIHERIVPVLRCVEQAITELCPEKYRPVVLSGIRKRNTYFNGEVSNHVYGIALDIDPTLNPCCGCVEPWRSNPRCGAGKNKYERMAMPRCWVAQFERFGFYWLGNAPMEDTMHFEFLGDPARIPSSDSRPRAD
ncbi:MAG TPA: M15 family metallopeptidase [Polyangiaceae bacterium]|nr:M15 family metallopeptidase [Polyangiaceae bacterium]